MLALSDNHVDNNNEKSESSVNCSAKLSSAMGNRKRPLSLRKCKSDLNVRRRLKIDEMGSNISRSRSLDNMESDSFVYESLTGNKGAKRDDNSLCGFEDSDDDYKLLRTSEDEEEEESCATTVEQILPAATAVDVDGHDIAESTNFVQASCDHHRSTLPRVKHEPHDGFARFSAPYMSLADRAPHEPSDKLSEFNTLPKTRSRQSEPHSIDSRKQSSISNAPEHTAAIIPAGLASTSTSGKNNFLLFHFHSPSKNLILMETFCRVGWQSETKPSELIMAEEIDAETLSIPNATSAQRTTTSRPCLGCFHADSPHAIHI